MIKKLFLVLTCFYIFSFGCAAEKDPGGKGLHKNKLEIKKESSRETSQKDLLSEHNHQRKIRKIKPLVIDQNLCFYAQKHAEKMARNNSLSHSQISNLQRSLIGENIAFGQETPKQVVSSWMNSSGHKSNILDQNYKKVGFGLAKDKNGRIYWCTVFSD